MDCPQNCDVLLAKIKELEYKLYWKDHSTEKLLNAMLKANMRDVRCDCHLCNKRGFWDGDYCVTSTTSEKKKNECRFRPWVFARMAECGLTVAVPDTDGRTPSKTVVHCSNETSGKVFKISCHIVDPKEHYAPMTYGELLWKAELSGGSSDNTKEELDKLSRFFRILLQGV
jgi:hypothetical protein